MSDKRLLLMVVVLAIAFGTAVLFGLQRSDTVAPRPVPTSVIAEADAIEAPRQPSPITYPPQAVAEFGVMAEAPKAELEALATPAAVAKLLEARHCGDRATCDVVRAYILAEGNLHLEVVPATNWMMPRDLTKATPTLSKAERESLTKRTIISVRALGPAFPEQMPARAAYAATAALAEKTHGLVFDQKTDRIERARTFLPRAITSSLDEPAFGRERIEVQYMGRPDGTVRLLTTGMTRFGAPDIEVRMTDAKHAPSLTEILYAVADTLASEETTSPITLTLKDVERVHGTSIFDDGTIPDPIPIAIDIETIHPEDGDPNMFMARILPPGSGATTEGYAAFAEAFFGEAAPSWDPSDDQFRQTKERAQNTLADVLTRWKAEKGAVLQALVPFHFAADGGADAGGEEDLWMSVTAFDAKSVSGILIDDGVLMPALKRGDKVTRPRGEVNDYQMMLPDGGVMSTRITE